MNTGIYKIQNQVNNKLYVGSGNIQQRFSNHKSKLRNNKHDNKHLQNSWNKYGSDNFKFKPLIYCAEGGLGYYEELLIVDVFESYKRKNGYNFKIGRAEGTTHSEESKIKISKSLKRYYKNNDHTMKGEQISQKTKDKISDSISGENHPFYGKTHTKETIEKISKNRPDFLGENNPFYGKTHDEETINKIKENMPDFSGENNPFYGESHDEETINKMNGEDQGNSKLDKKDVLDIKDRIFNTDENQKDIASEYNVSKSLITLIKSGEAWGHISL